MARADVWSNLMRLSLDWHQRLNGIAALEGRASSEFHDVRGRLVEVVRLSPGKGRPIVLVPGLAGGQRLLRPLARRLAAFQEVILYDLAGESDPFLRQRSDRVTEDAADLAALIARLRFERPAVFGLSYGGAVALELAVTRPCDLGALVLFGASSSFEPNLGSTIARRTLERFSLPADSPFINQFFNLLHGGVPRSADFARFVLRNCWSTDQGVMAARLRSLESFDVADRLWRIDVPTLTLAGSRDVVVTPCRQQELASRIAGSRFVEIEGAGHIGFLTHAPEVRQQVRHLLRDHLRASR
jgi:pimeloyl-ACP methyl ester carboxylesterase